jgi:hypothetical protein
MFDAEQTAPTEQANTPTQEPEPDPQQPQITEEQLAAAEAEVRAMKEFHLAGAVTSAEQALVYAAEKR